MGVFSLISGLWVHITCIGLSVVEKSPEDIQAIKADSLAVEVGEKCE